MSKDQLGLYSHFRLPLIHFFLHYIQCTYFMISTYRTGLVYDERLTQHACPFNSNHFQSENGERILQCHKRLQHYNLLERCTRVPVSSRHDILPTLICFPICLPSEKILEIVLIRPKKSIRAFFLYPFFFKQVARHTRPECHFKVWATIILF